MRQEVIAGLIDIRNALHSGRFGQREVWEKHLEDAIALLSAPTGGLDESYSSNQ